MIKYSGGRAVSLFKIAERTRKTVSRLKKIYLGLCSRSPETAWEAYFADNFHALLNRAGKRPDPTLRKKYVVFGDGERLSETVLEASGERLAGTDELILAIRSLASKRRIFGSELEYLGFLTAAELIEKIYASIKSDGRDVVRLMGLLGDLGGLDEARINDVLNPVAIKLSGDPAYRKSDPKTRLCYREAIYATALKTGADELKVCDSLLEKYRGSYIDITDLDVVREKILKPRHAVFAASALALSAAVLSVFISSLAGAPIAAVLLFLPAAEALRPLSDRILYRGRSFSRLMRCDPSADEVKNTPCAIVLSEQVRDAEDAAGLYQKMLRLHCSNPADNISVCALLDLPAEQVPITSEDRSVIEAIKETASKLEKISPGRFSLILRKRSFSETQQEYMGSLRKRGALNDLAMFMTTGNEDFYAAVGAYKKLIGVEYICAVDSDTLPGMDSVTELLCTALHPANKVKISDGRVVSGCGIIAPAMVTRLRDSLRSEFSKSLGGIGSVSSYDSESASLYQDVFGRGSFCGKGLINVPALVSVCSCLDGERILSHDILEGELLRTGYCGDVFFTEGFPKSPQSFYRRLDRWIRGDVQNIPEIFKSRYDGLSKLKLLDNLRRAATPCFVLLAFYAGFFLLPPSGAVIAAAALLLWLTPPVLGALSALFKRGSLSRSFYSGLMGSASHALRYILYSIVMLPTLAVKSARAIFLGLARTFVTKRNLLEWTTADSQDRLSTLPLRFYLIPETAALGLLWSPDPLIRLFGAVFSMTPAVLGLDFAAEKPTPNLKYRDSRELSKQVADMWGFFEKYAGKQDNFLPPDNVQFSPVYRIAHRTSPTNIGLYLLSCLAAKDRRLISDEALIKRLEKSLSAVERLEKYKGNLYNWYDTVTLKIVPPAFVSSVDSGNFVCCLVALKEGLKELGTPAEKLCRRISKIIEDTDLSVFYDGVRGLMAIGISEDGTMSRGRYDFLMSEARLCSFWAIASRQVPKSHWRALSRAMLSSGFFGGAASYSGTMFEYFMPELFLKSPEGSLFSESLKYALWVQKRYANRLGRPYGVSESGYFAFDPALNYCYSAHGVPNTGLRRGLEQDYVVSPYSTYLSMAYSPSDAAENLRELEKYGMYGSFGLYEALDFTCPDSDSPEPVRSYMSHHVGMSILGAVNVLNGGIMQKRFMRDLRVLGAEELIEERFSLGTAVFENVLRRPRISAPEVSNKPKEVITKISLERPRVKLMTGGELSVTVSDNGCCRSLYRSAELYVPTKDLIDRPHGIFFWVRAGEELLPISCLPDFTGGGQVEFTSDSAEFYRTGKSLRAGMKLSILKDMPVELRRFAFKNETAERLKITLSGFIEPSLQSDSAGKAHPAYSKLFLRVEKDMKLNIVTVSRLREDKKIYLGFGFSEDVDFSVSFDREDVLRDGLKGLGGRCDEIASSLICEPEPCIFLTASLEMPPKSETELSLFTVCAGSYDELINRVSEIRRKTPALSEQPRLDSSEGRVASEILRDIISCGRMSEKRRKSVSENKLPLSALWELSASTELPTALLVLNGKNDGQKLKTYLGAYKLLRRCGIETQLLCEYDDGGRYEREHYNELCRAAKEAGCEGYLYSPGGILPLDLSRARPGIDKLARAFACRICEDEIADGQDEQNEEKYIEILSSSPDPQPVDEPIACGGFSGDSYVINEKPPLPWCHVLANPVFGTLLSNASLGFSYAFNSRENRLTPWDNDPMNDNSGERLLLMTEKGMFDLINGSAAVFSETSAEYFSKGPGYRARVSVDVSEKGMCKRVRVKISAPENSRLIYCAEPCLGVDRSQKAMLLPKKFDGGITVHAPASETGGYMSLGCSEKCECFFDKNLFRQGVLEQEITPSANPCAGVYTDVNGESEAEFYLSFALSQSASENMHKYFSEQKILPDNFENDGKRKRLLKIWLRRQALYGRVYAKTGFYQCSGAFGFRDQLQDCCNLRHDLPGLLKAQILRCCTAQFFEGDVLHWAHIMPLKKKRGIRTLVSDDPLWLPYAVCEYLGATGDMTILGISCAYCDGINLGENETERYGEVYKTSRKESVYRHCKRAIDLKIGRTGSHGLMLIGSGDWNDGFNRVGINGKGESVWLTEFFIIVLKRFSDVAETLGEKDYANGLRSCAVALSEAVEKNARDPRHYIRGFFDSGEALGSCRSKECRIDSVAQSFAEFAGLGRDGFVKEALSEAYGQLYDKKRGIIKLFTPPFSEDASPDPGYISDYPEGMRENGGQYTHAAVWLALALKRAGLEEEAAELTEALDPIKKSEGEGYLRYKTEPYYLCGDVYANKNCMGRGGWSIYTGAAGWMYRLLGG